MLKIDLLPGYVRERRQVRVMMMVAGLALGGVASGLGFWWKTRSDLLVARKAKLELANQKKTEIDAIRTKTNGEKATAAPIKTMATFFKDAKGFGPQIELVLRELAKYSYNKVRIFTIIPTEAPAAGQQTQGGLGGGPGASGMSGMMSGMSGGALGGGLGSGAPSTGQDIKALELSCWTDDFRNMTPFINNLKKSALFTDAVLTVNFQFSPEEGPGSGGAGGGFGGAAGGVGMPVSGSGPPAGAAPAVLTTSRDGGTFTVVFVLATPIKGVSVPGAPAPQAAATMMEGAGGPPPGSSGMAPPGEGGAGAGGKAGGEEGGSGSKAEKRAMKRGEE